MRMSPRESFQLAYREARENAKIYGFPYPVHPDSSLAQGLAGAARTALANRAIGNGPQAVRNWLARTNARIMNANAVLQARRQFGRLPALKGMSRTGGVA